MPDRSRKKDTSHYDRCRTLMNVHKSHHQKRMLFFSILIVLNLYLAIAVPVKYHLSLIYGKFLQGVTFGVFAFVYSVGILALLLFAVPEKPKLLILAILLIILGIITDFIHLIAGIPYADTLHFTDTGVQTGSLDKKTRGLSVF